MSDKEPLTLTSLDNWQLTGRGTVHAVEVPDEFLDRRDPRTLVSRAGRPTSPVRGVDAFAVTWPSGKHALKKVGLLIGDVDFAPFGGTQ
jgi:hypothetical protein